MSTTMVYRRGASALAMLAMLALPHVQAGAAPTYMLVPVAGKYSGARDLNNAGQYVLNYSGPEVPYHIGSIGSPTMTIEIPTPPGTDNIVGGINNRADAVGTFPSPSGYVYAYSNASGRLRNLSSAYGLRDARDINDRGDIAGQLDQQAALVRANGTLEAFGGVSTYVTGINNQGTVVGSSVDEIYGSKGFVYADHQFTRLGTLGGTYSSAAAINDAGAIVGDASTATDATHGFLYEHGIMKDLAPSSRSSHATDINNDGEIVGEIDGSPFLYADGKFSDLNALIAPDSPWLLIAADDINDRHQILARSCDRSGVFCYGTFLLDPIPAVPEPGQVRMLFAGAVMLCTRRLVRAGQCASSGGYGHDGHTAMRHLLGLAGCAQDPDSGSRLRRLPHRSAHPRWREPGVPVCAAVGRA